MESGLDGVGAQVLQNTGSDRHIKCDGSGAAIRARQTDGADEETEARTGSE
jgi:hypothetical protein